MMKLRLIEKKKEIKDIVSFIFKPEKTFKWRAGQYLIYKVEHDNKDLRGKMRFFTISSSPFEKNLVLTTRIFAKNPSSFKNALSNLKIGSEIEVKGPDGDLFIDDINKNYIFVAGGVGITPFRSIIKHLAHKNLKVKINLLYANKDSIFLFKDELEESALRLKIKISYFIYPNKITPKDIRDLKPNLKKTIFFISGPEKMIYKIKELLNSLGVKDENIKEDYFTGYSKI